MSSEWILVGTSYGVGGRNAYDIKFRIDAVGPQGYVTVVPETPVYTALPSESQRNVGAENFTWASNGAEDTLRVSANERAYEYNVTLELP